MLKQLAGHQPSLLDSIRSLYGKHKDKQTRPSFNELSKTLQSAAAIYSRIFIIIDALDECHTTGGNRAKFLSDVFNLQAKYGANIFATSRPIPDIAEKFKGSTLLEIRASEDDVRKYLDGHILHLPSFVQRTPNLEEEIKTKIVEAVDGMYVAPCSLKRNVLTSPGFYLHGFI